MKSFNLRNRLGLRTLKNQAPLTDKELNTISELTFIIKTPHLDSLGLTLFRATKK